MPKKTAAEVLVHLVAVAVIIIEQVVQQHSPQVPVVDLVMLGEVDQHNQDHIMLAVVVALEELVQLVLIMQQWPGSVASEKNIQNSPV